MPEDVAEFMRWLRAHMARLDAHSVNSSPLD